MADPNLPWREISEGLLVDVRLTPKGGRDAIGEVACLADGKAVLLARVRAAPEDGRANDALCALLAEAAKVPRSSVRLHSGGKRRVKQVALAGDAAAIAARLSRLSNLPEGSGR